MAFKDVVGNEGVKRILRLALERGRVPNSLIFAGPEGVGKTDMALTLAKALNCQTLTVDSCDECPSCRAVDNESHPDVMTFAAEVQKVTVEQTDLIRQMAYLRPMTARRRVFIVEEAEKLNEHSANSLLKVLEEPPSFTHIILVTSNPFTLLATIRSRCRMLPFAPVGREEIEKVLRDRDFSPEQARVLALLADGNVDRARELEWEEVQALKASAWELFAALSSGDRPSRFLERFGNVPKAVHQEFAEVLEVFATFARDMLLVRTGGNPALLINPGFEDRLRGTAASWDPDRLLGLLAELDLLLGELDKNMNKNLLATAFVSNFGELRHA